MEKIDFSHLATGLPRSLEARKPADFTILGKDPLTVPPERIKDIKVQ